MRNLILCADSYKQSHFLQYPPEARNICAYIEARPNPFSDVALLLGLQPFLIDYLGCPVTRADIDEAEAICVAHGAPFNRIGWEMIVSDRGGFLPLEIKALPEGLPGFSEASLRRAYGRARNADIAAHIIGFVRQAALGDPLVPYAARVDSALAKIEASKLWTQKQK